MKSVYHVLVIVDMALGVFDTYIGEVNQGDTAELVAYLTVNGQPVTQDQIIGVNFTVQTPSVQTTLLETLVFPASTVDVLSVEGLATAGTFYGIDADGNTQMVAYTGISGTTLTGLTGGTPGATIYMNQPVTFTQNVQVTGEVQADGSGFYRWTNTQMVGQYVAQCQFSLITGEKRSVMVSFAVIDPFNPPIPSATDQITEQVWLRLEDLFDSQEGGPFLREMTHAHFDNNKIAAFIPEALLDINVQMPPTNYTLDVFTSSPEGVMNANMPILVKGVLVLTIRHLMRSYTEIYTPTGQGQLVWADRTRYQQAWGQIYQIEYQDYIAAVRLWKRTAYAFGHSALLTFNKAGRLMPYGAQSTRGVYRGYY